MPLKNDFTIPKELMKEFPTSLRIVDKKFTGGFWPVELKYIKKLQESLPNVFGNPAIMNRFNLAVTYQGKSMKVDFAKAGIEFIEDRILHDFWIHGIPVPWQYLVKAGIDNKKFGVMFVPK
jgi:hypothetical protein